jgi:hypothetical protein
VSWWTSTATVRSHAYRDLVDEHDKAKVAALSLYIELCLDSRSMLGCVEIPCFRVGLGPVRDLSTPLRAANRYGACGARFSQLL